VSRQKGEKGGGGGSPALSFMAAQKRRREWEERVDRLDKSPTVGLFLSSLKREKGKGGGVLELFDHEERGRGGKKVAQLSG